MAAANDALPEATLRKINNLVDDIKANRCRRIVLLTGAGISCASGIPDFRSAGGLYDTLRPALLTATEAERAYLAEQPTGVVEKSFFYKNQFPYLEVRRPFILGSAAGQWKPTIAHLMALMFQRKGLLRRIFDQNIDGLHRLVGLAEEGDALVEVHGSLSALECEFCKAPYPSDEFRHRVRTQIRNIYDPSDAEAPQISTNILCLSCGKAGVKPCTVLYGSTLPQRALQAMVDDFPDQVDLLIVAGTSLTVSPACNLVQRLRPATPRLIINDQPVGGSLGLMFDSAESKDIMLTGQCDDGFILLARLLGWLEEMAEVSDVLCDSSRASLLRALQT
jgi:NAD-dependent SIR2 family protein deacetylase